MSGKRNFEVIFAKIPTPSSEIISEKEVDLVEREYKHHCPENGQLHCLASQ